MDRIKERLQTIQALKKSGKTLEQVFQEEINVDNFTQSQVPNIKRTM